MGDRQWMYNGWASAGRVTQEWITNAQAFLDEAFSKVKGHKDSKTTWCPAAAVETHVVLQRWTRHHIS
jgi:hypothetical protein